MWTQQKSRGMIICAPTKSGGMIECAPSRMGRKNASHNNRRGMIMLNTPTTSSRVVKVYVFRVAEGYRFHIWDPDQNIPSNVWQPYLSGDQILYFSGKNDCVGEMESCYSISFESKRKCTDSLITNMTLNTRFVWSFWCSLLGRNCTNQLGHMVGNWTAADFTASVHSYIFFHNKEEDSGKRQWSMWKKRAIQ